MSRKPHLALVGPTGAGKTSIGRALAAQLGRPFVDLDAAIERQAGATVALIFEVEGESGFRRREREVLRDCLAGEGSVIACGGGAVTDPDNRAALRERAFVVHVTATVEQQLARLARDRTRPLLQTPDRRARLEALAAARDPLYAALADLVFHSDGGGAAQAARALAARLDPAWRNVAREMAS